MSSVFHPDTTFARELPGPSDLTPLFGKNGIPVAITTPTGALRVIEIVEVKKGVFQPRLRTILKGSTFTKNRQIKIISKWRRNTNAGAGNLNIINKARGKK